MNPITYFKKTFLLHQTPDERRKFIELGMVFCTILAAYWTLGTIKESFLSVRIGTVMLPYAKIASLLFLIPTLWVYAKLLTRFSRERLFITLSLGYAGMTAVFAYYIGAFGVNAEITDPSKALFISYSFSFLFYSFVESYGSLMVALFWAVATNTTKPESAQRGFPLVVLLGQIGGIIGPLVLCKIPRYFYLSTSSISVYLSSVLIILSSIIFAYFLRTTPASLLQPFYSTTTTHHNKKNGFFEGLTLITRSPYLTGIVLLLFFYEFISQLYDYYFKCFAAQQISELHLAEYIGFYGSAINFTTLICLLLGINTITTSLGVTYSLLTVPILVGASLIIFMFYQTSTVLFVLLVLLKAIHFSLTVPTTKQLYIPTSYDVQFKAQAWIDTFGSRIARQTSGIYQLFFNWLYQPQSSAVCFLVTSMFNHYFCLLLVIAWMFTAHFVGRQHDQALKRNAPIC